MLTNISIGQMRYATMPAMAYQHSVLMNGIKEKDIGNNILAFGDSITQGMNFGIVDNSFINMGIGGDTIEGVTYRLNELLTYLTTNNKAFPKAILVTVGVNNLILYGENGTSLESRYDGLMMMLLYFVMYSNWKTRIVVQGVLPTEIMITEDNIQHMNKWLSRNVPRYGYNFIPRCEALVEERGFMWTKKHVLSPKVTTDTLHLNSFGNGIWGDYMKSQFKALGLI